MQKLIRCDSSHPDFVDLVDMLNKDLAVRDGEDFTFYNQFNGIQSIKYAVICYIDDVPVGCGAIKAFGEISMEVKRMYTRPQHRRAGVSVSILKELEAWGNELNVTRLVLETGKNQPEAIQLYTKYGFQRIPNYGQYFGVENSLCFEKKLK